MPSVEESGEVPIADGLNRNSGTSSLHTSAKFMGWKRQRQGGGAGKPSPCACLPWQAEARDHGGEHLRKGECVNRCKANGSTHTGPCTPRGEMPIQCLPGSPVCLQRPPPGLRKALAEVGASRIIAPALFLGPSLVAAEGDPQGHLWVPLSLYCISFFQPSWAFAMLYPVPGPCSVARSSLRLFRIAAAPWKLP